MVQKKSGKHDNYSGVQAAYEAKRTRDMRAQDPKPVNQDKQYSGRLGVTPKNAK